MLPLEVLYERRGLPGFDLPAELSNLYGGPLGFAEPRVFANFVTTLDGVVAVPGVVQANRLISGDIEADRFVMGLLRACADVVLIGSGTLHGSPRTRWTPGHAYPGALRTFAELRSRRKQPPEPQLAVVTGSGSIQISHPALEAGALVLTTEAGAARLRGRLPAAVEVLTVGDGTSVAPRDAVRALLDRDHRFILTEAGPRLFGSLLAAGLVDEVFLTSSPVLAGRGSTAGRMGLVEGTELLPERRLEGRLLGVRRQGEHLFLRYEFPTRTD
jgi:riboflavin biosynthesis pyrimidine reductase